MTDSSRSPAAFIEWMVARHSDLVAIRDEHLRDYGELLPHVLVRERHALCRSSRAKQCE